ncbi:hypothetical protein N866_00315 [Actinotalea ferrariae CF5-4]|uniref:Uncharacterized protein n=1 Tax=Actinotalea ferrariae CF5-4 TaxID=948458 RepID=A0A021VVN9_9CELL|nr:hypothetical protein N866_00315 [Actinotalea ferrariae CF5-4]
MGHLWRERTKSSAAGRCWSRAVANAVCKGPGFRYLAELEDPDRAKALKHPAGLADLYSPTLPTATKDPEISEAVVRATLLRR